MSSMFETFPDDPAISSATPIAQESALQRRIEKQERQIRELKQKQKKLKRRLAEIREQLRLDAQRKADEEQKAQENPALEQSFFRKLGDAILKKFEKIDSVIVSAVAGLLGKKIIQGVKNWICGMFAPNVAGVI